MRCPLTLSRRSAAYAAASLKLSVLALPSRSCRPTFRSLCCGLIEAAGYTASTQRYMLTFRSLCCGLIEAVGSDFRRARDRATFRSLCCGLIEACDRPPRYESRNPTFRSLCCGLIEARHLSAHWMRNFPTFRSLCCGLIEAHTRASGSAFPARRSAAYAAASLKLQFIRVTGECD